MLSRSRVNAGALSQQEGDFALYAKVEVAKIVVSEPYIRSQRANPPASCSLLALALVQDLQGKQVKLTTRTQTELVLLL